MYGDAGDLAVPDLPNQLTAMHLREALDQFLIQLQADGRSGHTVAQYRRHLNLLARWCASEALSCNVEDFDHQDLARFLGSTPARTRSDGRPKLQTSVNALRSSIRAFFVYAHGAGATATNPARLIRRALTGGAPPRALTPAEEGKLLSVLAAAEGPEGSRDGVLFRLLLRAGLRLGSALGLDVNDLDLTEGVATIRVKGGRIERAFLPAETRAELAAFLQGREPGPVFGSQSGRRLSPRHVQRRFSRVRESAGLPVTVSCHSLRHSFATRLLEKTGDLGLVQKALGHRSASSTAIYARTSDKRLRDALGA